MTRVAGVDGARGGWAVVIKDADKYSVQRITALSDLADEVRHFDIIAIDIPIGLLDSYEVGGRQCDRAARAILGKRASSVFPAPIRSVLGETVWEKACARSRESSNHNKAISKQLFGIVPKIKEVDDLLQAHPALRDVMREIHPEVCFSALAGAPMVHNKKKQIGRDERRDALRIAFPALDLIEQSGKAQGLHVEDVLDATVASWSAQRIATGNGHSLVDPISLDATGLPMTIWV